MKHSLRVLTLLVPLLMGCSSETDPDPGPSQAHVRFTCCRGTDLKKTYYPGDVIELHWVSTTTNETSSNSRLLTLAASFAETIGDMSAGKARAAPIKVPDDAGQSPVSRLRIPQSAVPGWYSITTSTDDNGAVVSSTTSICVALR